MSAFLFLYFCKLSRTVFLSMCSSIFGTSYYSCSVSINKARCTLKPSASCHHAVFFACAAVLLDCRFCNVDHFFLLQRLCEVVVCGRSSSLRGQLFVVCVVLGRSFPHVAILRYYRVEGVASSEWSRTCATRGNGDTASDLVNKPREISHLSRLVLRASTAKVDGGNLI